jgi:hypothetical protein
MKDRSVSYWFNVGDTVKVVSPDVSKGGMNLWNRIGKVVETWEKCDVDPTCCCAEQVDPNMAVRVEFIGSLTTADDDDDSSSTFNHYFAESELVKVSNDEDTLSLTEETTSLQSDEVPFDGKSCVAFKLDQLSMGRQAQRIKAFEESLLSSKEVQVVEEKASSTTTATTTATTYSYSSSSPWAPSNWILKLNFGKEESMNDFSFLPFKFMDESSTYGASGSRLVVLCPVLVTADDIVDPNHKDDIVGRGASVIRPTYSDGDFDGSSSSNNKKHYSYITLQGQQSMELSSGGWVLEFPPSSSSSGINRNKNKGMATKLRFWMDLLTDIERNDVKINGGTRLYFLANCWREEDFDIGIQKLKPIQYGADEARRIIEERLSHETGDRRLDGVDALETMQAYGDMAKLVLEKDQKVAKLQEALQMYPSSKDGDIESLPEGPWPGSDEWLTLSDEKYNPIFIVEDKGILRGREYRMVGTWTAEPIIPEDEYGD